VSELESKLCETGRAVSHFQATLDANMGQVEGRWRADFALAAKRNASASSKAKPSASASFKPLRDLTNSAASRKVNPSTTEFR